jgi:translation initiation factor 2B subunit (eIF-2B alpha/beta/delta family)
MSIYGDYSDEIREALRDIADDRMDAAVRDLEAMYAEDDEDYSDQLIDIVNEFVSDVKSCGEDLIGNGFDHETAESAIYSMDVMGYYRDNESECEQAFDDCSSMSDHSSIREAVEAAVFYQISQQVSNELNDALDDLDHLEDEMLTYLQG